ncbi:MAG: beta-lactamase family protein [Rhodothermales bacterium]|nr:beta-lactamase family protein [Rhodothermales bacterium]MBO6778228.1 beta-lactamase family protein [Rhodothermales bacterium]
MTRSFPVLCGLVPAILLVFACKPSLHEGVGVGVGAGADTLIYDLRPEEGGEPASLVERMEHYGVPGVSVAVLRDGDLAWAEGFGVKLSGTSEQVDAETVFSVGSLSKVGAAATSLRLADAGRVSLDDDVDGYLTSWSIPENAYSEDSPVTLRRLMSHTAGTTVHGFADFQPGEDLPTTVQILNGDGPAKSRAIVVDTEPGTLWRYSGGGTTVQQLIIEDVTGTSFAEAARTWVFEPLGMDRSTYVQPLPAAHGNIARAHDRRGNPSALPRGWEAFPESAASGLWTTPTEYARMLIAFRDAWLGESDSFLSQELARDLMTEVAPGSYGLGPQLGGEGSTRFYRHGGANESYRAYFIVYLESGDGAVVFTNGARGGDLNQEILDALSRSEGWPNEES